MTNKTEQGYGWNPQMPFSLLEKIRRDLKQAMLKNDPEVRNAMRLIMAEFPKLTVPLTLESGKKSTRLKKPAEITDDDILGIINGLVKSEQIVLEAKKQASSTYLEILHSYLPKQVTREEIEAWIKENIDFSQYKNKMQAMGTIMKHFGKAADGKQVNQILKEWG
ncbi:MAG: GatB/YqeY domain-containing protein [Desulfobacterales bacterium]